MITRALPFFKMECSIRIAPKSWKNREWTKARPCGMMVMLGLLQNAAAQRREKNEKRKEEVFSYEND
jgi:hypothetical protein